MLIYVLEITVSMLGNREQVCIYKHIGNLMKLFRVFMMLTVPFDDCNIFIEYDFEKHFIHGKMTQ